MIEIKKKFASRSKPKFLNFDLRLPLLFTYFESFNVTTKYFNSWKSPLELWILNQLRSFYLCLTLYFVVFTVNLHLIFVIYIVFTNIYISNSIWREFVRFNSYPNVFRMNEIVKAFMDHGSPSRKQKRRENWLALFVSWFSIMDYWKICGINECFRTYLLLRTLKLKLLHR